MNEAKGHREQGIREGESYWQIVGRQLRANRLAMVGLALILFVITVAVYAPLLANDKPLYFKAVLTDRYDEAYFTLLDAIEQLGGELESGFSDAEERERFLGYAFSGIRRMKDHLTRPQEETLRRLEAALKDGFRGQTPSEDEWSEIVALKEEAAERYDYMNLELQPTTTYPAIRNLSITEAFFLLLWFSAIFGWLLRRRMPPRALALLVLLPPIAGSVAWGVANPPRFDVTPYKQIVADAEEGTVQAIFPPVPFGENENITAERRQPPTWMRSAEERAAQANVHWLGTDTNGRDVLCRMIYGARISTSIGFVAVSIYIVIGVILGALAGYYGGWTDIVISRAIELMICFPVFFLILIVLFFFRPNILNIMIVLGLTGWTNVARLQRGEFLRLVNQEFVQAIRALGGSDFRIIFRHILPNGVGPILVVASFGVAAAILVESALSFLGFGVPQPTASWGDILNNGRNDIQGTWWLTVFPGIAIFVTVTAYNLFGEGLRDAIDPRLKQ